MRAEFHALDEVCYLNAASQGPLPERAVAALRAEALENARPYRTASARHLEIPARVRERVGAFIGAPPTHVALMPGTTFGVNAVAQGLRLGPGDEVLCLSGAFPANVYPWLDLARKGVRVVFVGAGGRATPADVERCIGPRTRVLALPLVHFATGFAPDLDRMGTLTRDRGIFLFIDGTQGVGAVDFDLGLSRVDAIACAGHKWLCSPVGTGFLAIHPASFDRVEPVFSGWLSRVRNGNFADLCRYDPAPAQDATRFEQGSPSLPLLAAFEATLSLFLEVGRSAAARHVSALVARLRAGIQAAGFCIKNPDGGPSGILAFEHPAPDDLRARAAAQAIHVAHREGAIRVSPHIYNTPAEIDRLLAFI